MTTTSIRTTRRLATVLAVTASAIGLCANGAAARTLPGSPGPIAKGASYVTLGDFASGTGGSTGGPIIGWNAGANPVNPMYGAPAIVVAVPPQDLSTFGYSTMNARTSAANLNRVYQVRVQCADGYVFQSPTQVFTSTGSDPVAGASIPRGSKALEWPTVADRQALDSTFAAHYRNAGCTAEMAITPAGRTPTSEVSVDVPADAASSPDNPFMNPEGMFRIAVRVSGTPGGSY